MTFKYIIFHIFLVTCLAFILLKGFHYINSFYRNPYIDSLDNIRPSSVWCNGLKNSDRKCRFVNLCYKKDTEDYIFAYNDKLSIVSGIPSDRFAPALIDLSSVEDHNQFYFNYVEIPLMVLQNNLSKTYKFETIKEKTFIFSRFKPDNLMHSFHDDIIPLYFTLHEIGWNQIHNIFFDDFWPINSDTYLQFNKYIYNHIFPKSFSRLEMNNNTIYCFEEAFVGLSKSMAWYQYGFRSPQSPISRTNEESFLISSTIRRLTYDLISETKCSINYVILISRKSTRKILNQNQLLDLISKTSKLSVITVMIEDFNYNFKEIIKKVYCAKLIIGMHGSALILSMFLQSGSSLIEMFPFAINSEYFTPYKTLTQLKGMNINYFYWRNRNINNTLTHSEYPKELGGIQHLSNEERQQISSNTQDVPKHLCCSDVYWLYRIYQDTIVDIDSIQPILKTAIQRSSQNKIQLTKPLASSLVIGSYCSRRINDDQTHDIHIGWEQPWNVRYIKELNTKTKYEILIQEVNSNSAKKVMTSEKEYTFVTKSTNAYNIWIRCNMNEISGPFNINPLIC